MLATYNDRSINSPLRLDPMRIEPQENQQQLFGYSEIDDFEQIGNETFESEYTLIEEDQSLFLNLFYIIMETIETRAKNNNEVSFI